MATSYDFPFGVGDRRNSITVTSNIDSYSTTVVSNLVNGSEAANVSNSWSPLNPAAVTGVNGYIQFDFGATQTGIDYPPVIDEFRYVSSSSASRGTWKFQGSADASTWTDIGTPFTLSGTNTTITAINGNTTGYRYYRLQYVSGTVSDSGYWSEIYFKGEFPGAPDAPVAVSQAAALVLSENETAPVKLSQAAVLLLTEQATEVRLSQSAVLLLTRKLPRTTLTDIYTGYNR